MFMGLDGFNWFTGVVEDRKDPEKRGRVRVRIWALHSKEKQVNDKTGQGIPTEDLPWAMPIRPITSAAMDGIGNTPLGLVEGTWVVGFARDGDVYNDLFILGSIGGKPEDAPKDNNGKDGFVDPRTAGEISDSPRYINKVENRDPGYPGMDIPQGRYPQEKWLNEVDVNRLARAEKLDETLIKPKREDLEKNIPTAFMSLWDELPIPYNAKYPYNHVFETESGHVMEFDDTKDAERFHLWHKSKSYLEIHNDGKMQVKTQKDFFTIARGNIHSYAEEDMSLTSKKDFGIMSKTGNVKILSALGDVDVEAFGEINMLAKGQNSFHMTAEGGPMTMTASKSAMTLSSLTPMSMTSLTAGVSVNAPSGSISSTALQDINTKSLSGSVGISSLGGNISLSSAVGAISATASTGMNLTSALGAISANAGLGMNLTAALGSINLSSIAGSISAQASSAISMLAGAGGMNLSTVGGAMNLASGGAFGLTSALGILNLTTPNPLGSVIQSVSSLGLSSTGGNVSISSSTSNVQISAGGSGQVDLNASNIIFESPDIDFITDDLILEGQVSATLRAVSADISIEAATSISVDAATLITLDSGTDIELGAVNITGVASAGIDFSATGPLDLTGEDIQLIAGSSMLLQSGTTMGLNATGNMEITSAGILELTGTSIILNGPVTYSTGITGDIELITPQAILLQAGTTVDIESDGAMALTSVGNLSLASSGLVAIDAATNLTLDAVDITATATGVFSLTATADIELNGEDISLIATGMISHTAQTNLDLQAIGGALTLTAGTALDITATDTVSMNGDNIVITATPGTGVITLNGLANTSTLDAYSTALRAYFDLRYAPHP